MGLSQRDKTIQDLINLPGVSPDVANQIYDMGFHSLKDLSKADANYLFRLGVNRQLSSNIERVMDIWKREDGNISISDAVDISKGRRSRKKVEPRTEEQRSGIQSRQVMTQDGIVKNLKVCVVCKNLVTISDQGECPYCRDHPRILPAKMILTEEDEDKAYFNKVKKKIRECKKLLENCEMDGLDVRKSWTAYKNALESFEENDLRMAEKYMKKTVALVEVVKMNRRRELEKERRRISGEIDDGGDVKWDLRNRGRLYLWQRWQRGLKSFVTPGSFEDEKQVKDRDIEHHRKTLRTLAKITIIIMFLVSMFIFTLIIFKFLDTVYF